MTPQGRIQELREQIDTINLDILALLNQRAEVASEIGSEQSKLSTQHYDPAREAQIAG